MYQRQKVTSDAGTASLRRTHACHGSARSLQNALPAGHDGDACRASHLNNLMAIEEKPLTTCGRVRVLRSSYQAYGVVMAIARLAAYALTIGLLDRWPAVQSGVLLGLGIVYFVYLRFAVPYSRRDEMALEYWQALLDIILFVLLLVLSLAIDATNSVQVNNMGIGMLVVQGLGFISYFINRSLIVVHAFHEIVCPHWTMAVRRPWKTTKKKKIQRRSLSNDGSISLDGVEVPLSVRCVCRDFNGTCHRSNDEQMRLKTSNSNGKKCEAHRQNICAGENQSISEGRNPRPGMVPSIAENRPMLHEEETLSVRLTGNRRSTEKRSSSGAMSVHICGPSSCVPQYLPPASGITEALQDSGASLEEGEKAERHAVPDPLKAGENDIFDRFWKSI